MAQIEITENIDAEAGVGYDYVTEEITLGSGNSYTMGVGVNTERQTWNCTYMQDVLTSTTYAALKSKLRGSQGYQKVYWTNPQGERLAYLVQDLKEIHLGANAWRLSWVLRQTY